MYNTYNYACFTIFNNDYNLSIIIGVDVVDVVRPFCDVVVNEETTGPITGQAISALDKFLASRLLHSFSVDIQL